LLGVLLVLRGVPSQAAPGLDPGDPVGFFTNTAIRLLLKSGYTVGPPNSTSNLLVTNIVEGVPVTRLQIPIWPTNFYTPSVHRLLQLAANLYDATTNRTDNGYPTNYPYLPTVFRPLFLSSASGKFGGDAIWIVGYREVTPADMTSFISTRPPHDLTDANDRLVNRLDMVYNIPLVIGAKKGLPSFDEFTADTQIQVARKLIFHRAGSSTTTPVNELDPAYYLTITNVVGLQAWNSYAAAYNRPVAIYAWPDTTVLLTNENGVVLNPPTYPARQPLTAPPPVNATQWPGFNVQFPGPSFIVPLGALPAGTTNYVFLPTNAVYSFRNEMFLVGGTYDRTPGFTNYHAPRFVVALKARLRFALVDVASDRLLDYVNLASDQVVDVMAALADSGCGQYYSAVYSKGGMWCTNLPGAGYPRGVDPFEAFGVRLQMDVSSGIVQNADWTSSLQDPVYGRDRDKGVARFLFQFTGLGLAGPGEPGFVNLNTFTAPFSPFRNLHIVTAWEANDPLVHYTVGDLQDVADFPHTVYLDLTPNRLPPSSYGNVTSRYQPWGRLAGNGYGGPGNYDLTAKDPVAAPVGTSDNWDFPTNLMSSASLLGRVHRGTPWQTVDLKAVAAPSSTSSNTWVQWTGDSLLVTNFGQLSPAVVPPGGVVSDALLSHPIKDRRLASMLASLFNTDASRRRISANETNPGAWEAALDGMLVLTNNEGINPPDGLASLVMSSNSPQAAIIAAAILASRAAQPNQSFADPGDILATPELSLGSPWLNTNDVYELDWGITDAAYEAIPAQLLPLLRADSAGYVVQNGGVLQVQFSGSDGLAYAVQVSTDLVNWATVATNYPVGGTFSLLEAPSPGAGRRFYRSVLLEP